MVASIVLYSVVAVAVALLAIRLLYMEAKDNERTVGHFVGNAAWAVFLVCFWPVTVPGFLLMFTWDIFQERWANKPVSELWKKTEATEPDSLLRPSQDSHALLVPAKTKWEGD